MILRCPGRDARKITTENIRCLACGYEVEVFSDELKAYCPQCRSLVYKIRFPSCLDWCKAAKECLGRDKR